MVSLYRRSTLRQAAVLRIVEGAARNAAHAHPKWPFDDRLAKSIAKRAAGTLTAQWPDVLAMPARVSSDRAQSRPAISAHAVSVTMERSRGRARVRGQRVLFDLRKQLGVLAGAARRAGQSERHATLVEVLRLLASLKGDRNAT